MRLRLLPAARADADDAAIWYATEREGLDTEFLVEVRRVGRLVLERPRAWTQIEPGIHRAILRRFPYSLIYRIEPNEIVILAVAHHSRDPGYWRERS